MKTTHAKVEFARLPKDYAGLCRILTPRPIHDKVEFQNVIEITDAMAGHKEAGVATGVHVQEITGTGPLIPILRFLGRSWRP